MKRLKTIRPAAWIAMAFLVLWLVVLWFRNYADRGLDSQFTAERWQAGGTKYSQVSAFISEDAAFTDNAVLFTRQAVDEALTVASLNAENDGARLWIDAYSAEAAVTAANDVNTQTARAICTGGDFFRFHPLDMISGWYYSGDEATDAVVVLDQNLAWKIFGGTDVAGMELYVNGYACTVAGVSAVPQNKDEKAAYGSEATLYIPYSFMERQKSGAPVLTCYEAVLPEAVKDFGTETIKTALGFEDTQCEVLQNTDRFSFGNSIGVAKTYESRSQRTGRIYYPWWENAARAVESRSSLLAVLLILLAVYPVIYGVVMGVRYGKQGVGKLKDRISKRKENSHGHTKHK